MCLDAQNHDDVRVRLVHETHQGSHVVVVDLGGEDQGQRGAESPDRDARRGGDRGDGCAGTGVLQRPPDQGPGAGVRVDQEAVAVERSFWCGPYRSDVVLRPPWPL